jgi:UDP-glucose 4-epimerase
MVVPRFVRAALSNEPITVYGDGNQTRCFAHVYDVIDAVLAIAFSKVTIGKAINIGNDFEISINNLAKKIISETGSKSEIVHVPYAEAYGDGFQDMERRVPNIGLINQLVGWSPKRDLSTMIADISDEMKKTLKAN